MAIALVQSKTGLGTAATTTTAFDTAPTSGNLVVLAFSADDYNASPDSGWTQSAEMEQQTFLGGYIWWRISDGGNSLPYTIGSATHSSWVLQEFSGVDATPYDISEGQFAQSSATSYTTANITPTTGDRVLVAAMGGSSGALALNGAYTSWLNSFTAIANIGKSSTPATCCGTAYRLVTGDGSTAFSSGATFPTTVQARTGLIIAFKAGASVQNITGALFSNSATFHANTVSSNYPVSGALFSDSDTLHATTVTSNYTVSGGLLANSASFKTATISTSYAVSGALFTESDTFFAASIGTSAQDISGGLFTESDTFQAATLSATYNIVGGLLTNSNTFAASSTASVYPISGTLFANSQTFPAATLSKTYAISGALFTNSTTFQASAFSQYFSVNATLFVDGDTFHASTQSNVISISGSLFTDPDTFYNTITTGGVSMSGGIELESMARRRRR